MTEKEYYYNLELLEFLENLVKTLSNSSTPQNYFIIKIYDLREEVVKMFDEYENEEVGKNNE